MGVISKLEGGLDSAFDKAAGAVFRGPIEPAQFAKRAEKHMNNGKLVGAGKQYAPTLYTILVNPNDDRKLFAFYPTIAAEIETYLVVKGTQNGLQFDGHPLVRFIVDRDLKSGKFDVIAENVSAPTIAQLREEEKEFYGLKEKKPAASSKDRKSGASSSGFDAKDSIDKNGRKINIPLVLDLEADGAEDGSFVLSEHRSGRTSSPLGAAKDPSQSSPLGKARLSNLNAGKSYAFTKALMILGRDTSCDIVIDDANISRQHAQFSQDAVGTWKIIDLDSTNGTKLNGSKVATALLRDGDQITLGVTALEFREHE